jgi:alcohol dehydrogenase YqhD (iron-dependent ADH family)
MDELVNRLSAAAGLDHEKAVAAVKTILVFLDKEAPPDAVKQLVDAIPGAQQALDEGRREQGGAGDYAGFGAMAAYHALTAVGLSGGEVQIVTKELLAHSRDAVGDETTGRIVGAVPGLEAFV